MRPYTLLRNQEFSLKRFLLLRHRVLDTVSYDNRTERRTIVICNHHEGILSLFPKKRDVVFPFYCSMYFEKYVHFSSKQTATLGRYTYFLLEEIS